VRTALLEKGRSREEVLAELRDMKAGDADWRHGRVPLYVQGHRRA
jgi:sphinganine-1-phosphate aldolase